MQFNTATHPATTERRDHQKGSDMNPLDTVLLMLAAMAAAVAAQPIATFFI